MRSSAGQFRHNEQLPYTASHIISTRGGCSSRAQPVRIDHQCPCMKTRLCTANTNQQQECMIHWFSGYYPYFTDEFTVKFTTHAMQWGLFCNMPTLLVLQREMLSNIPTSDQWVSYVTFPTCSLLPRPCWPHQSACLPPPPPLRGPIS